MILVVIAFGLRTLLKFRSDDSIIYADLYEHNYKSTQGGISYA